jgi:hypothetical protein
MMSKCELQNEAKNKCECKKVHSKLLALLKSRLFSTLMVQIARLFCVKMEAKLMISQATEALFVCVIQG